jgi:hypothetical protein
MKGLPGAAFIGQGVGHGGLRGRIETAGAAHFIAGDAPAAERASRPPGIEVVEAFRAEGAARRDVRLPAARRTGGGKEVSQEGVGQGPKGGEVHPPKV